MKIRLLFLSSLLFAACTDVKQQEKDQLKQVLKVHDEVMGKTESAMKNKMWLDTLAMQKPETKAEIEPLTKQLTIADEAMENWMHKFNPDNTGKSHDEVMKYLEDQKKQIVVVDSMLTNAINQSGKYLSSHKK